MTFIALLFLATYGKCSVQVYFTNSVYTDPKKTPNTKAAVPLSMCNVHCFGGQKESHTVDTIILLLYISFHVKNKKLPDQPAIFTSSFSYC